MMENQIYVTLASNASMDLFSSNRATRFRTRLAREIVLEGKWSVALSEIHIPCTWFNVTKSNNSLIGLTVEKKHEDIIKDINFYAKSPCENLTELHDDEGLARTCLSLNEIAISPGYYESTKHVLKHLNWQMKEAGLQAEFKHNLKENRVFLEATPTDNITFHSVVVFPKESSGLGQMLGFEEKDIISPSYQRIHQVKTNRPVVAKYPPDMTGGIYGIYVYTDIVQPQFVGDTTAPLLRIVPVDRNTNTIQYLVFPVLDYFPVSRSRIDTIEIDLRTDFGENLIFEAGKVIVKLQFRKDY